MTNKKLIAVGSNAPDFALLDQDGNQVTLASWRGRQPVLLIFYPGDETMGCTRQLCAIRDDWAEFQHHGVMVYGVNHADAESHRRFIQHHHLTVPLLIDTEMKVAEKYEATRSYLGRRTIKRSVILIDKHGIIRYLKRGLPPDNEILEAVKQL